MRQIILDTETTGLSPEQGHRVIEIGCVEMMHRRLTGKTFHVYLNPEREVDKGAFMVHGISNDFLKDKPLFHEIVDEFITFIKDAELIIHNAPFDVGFLESEFKRVNLRGWEDLSSQCTVTDTLAIARKKHPGQKNNLDALCKRYQVNNQHREKHGALLDAEILADVYLAMTGGQSKLDLESNTSQTMQAEQEKGLATMISDLPIRLANESECELHTAFLQKMKDKYRVEPLWELEL
ncbi:MAG: DNA polymerase III subunit epsilon [Candidatus Berkiella sp.]